MLTLAGVLTRGISTFKTGMHKKLSKNVWKELDYKEIMEDAKQNKSRYLEEWKNIPWKKIEKSIYDLQCDIASAEIEGNKKKARNLQRILIARDTAILLAIRKVTIDNKGSKTPGIDGMVIKSHPERMALYNKLKSYRIKWIMNLYRFVGYI